MLCHVALVEGGLGGLWQALALRVGSHAADHGVQASFGLGGFLERQAFYFWTGFSALAACLSLAWVLRARRQEKGNALLVAALAAFGLFNVAAFRQGAYVHIYYQFYLAIPLALAAGLALAEALRHRGWRLAAFCLAALVAAEGAWKLAPVWRQQAWEGFLGDYKFYPLQMPMADYLKRATEPQDRVLLLCGLPYSFRQVTYYSDRNITVAATMAEAKRLWEGGGYTKAFAVRRISGYGIEPLFTPGPPAKWECLE